MASNFKNRLLSKQITTYITVICGVMLLITCTAIYIVLSQVIESQDHELIQVKADYVMPHVLRGDPKDIQLLLAARYPQDLPKRLYVVVYEDAGSSIGRTFNTYSKAITFIFPEYADPHWPRTPGTVTDEKIHGPDKSEFELSTRVVRDQNGKIWIIRIAVDHDAEMRISSAIKVSLILILTIAIVVIPLSSGLVSKILTKPLLQLSDELRKTLPGKNYPKIDENSYPLEMNYLIRTFATLSREAEIAFERLYSFSSDISHELRNPIHSMRINLESLLSRERSNQEYRDSTFSLLDDAKRLGDLVESLLFLLRGERRLLTAVSKEVDLYPLLSGLCEMYGPIIEEAGGRLTMNCANNLFVFAEPHLLQRALVNLIENTIKYAIRDDGTPLQVSVEVTNGKDEGSIEIAIKDNGPGISEDDVPYIFDRLYRADRSRHKRGFGLGLSIVRMVAELHGGGVTLRKHSFGECVFVISLPGKLAPNLNHGVENSNA